MLNFTDKIDNLQKNDLYLSKNVEIIEKINKISIS